MILGRIPIGRSIEYFIEFLETHIGFATNTVSDWIEVLIDFFQTVCLAVPPVVFGGAIVLLALKLAGRNVAIFTAVGLYLIYDMNLWIPTITTIAMVVVATLISICLGVPIGILSSRSDTVNRIVTPILDFMQTMPAFVYLIPVIPFFGLGTVPGVMATVIFAMPPTIRLTNLGIRQVPKELIEASDSFGSTDRQKLVKVQLPMAKPTIMAGINQTIMLALSMVVIAAMIGAKGLGGVVWKAIQRLEVGMGFEGGLGVVIVAIILDRLTQQLSKGSGTNL